MIDFALTPPIIATYMLSNLFLVYVTFRLYCVYFTRTQVNKRLEFFCFAVFYLLNTSACLLLQAPIFNLLTATVPLVGITFLYPERLQKKLLISLGCYALLMAIDSVLYFVYGAFEFASWQRFVLTAPVQGLIALVYALVMQKQKQPKSQGQLAFLHWLAILVIPIGSIVILGLTIYIVDPIPALAISIIQIFINVLVFYLFDTLGKYYADRNEKQLLQQQNRAYSDQFALMRQTEQQVRALRHDMKNHLSILRQYADEGRTEELEQYLDAFALKLSPKAEYVATGNRELDSILNYKLGQAEAAGAVLTLDVSLPEQLVVDVFDLNVVLGNLLDNATEGVAGSSDKGLSLYLRLDRGVLYIKLTNAYDGVVNTERTADALRYRTRKQDSTLHGLGLESVRATVEKYHGYLEISHQDKQFTVEAVLYTA